MINNTVQSVFLAKGKQFREKNVLSAVQLKAMNAIENCRTERSGFHIYACDHCKHEQIAYNSCSNRNCPNCQQLKQEVWIDKIKSCLPPVKYVHVEFTLPEDFVVGRPVRLKGLGNRIGPWRGDLYIRLYAKI